MIQTSSLVLLCAVATWPITQVQSLVYKRDTPFVPARLEIPLTFDHGGRAVTTVIMSPDHGQQAFNFTMSTGTGLTYVMGTQCSSCSGATLYNRTESTTGQTFSTADSVPLFGLPTDASIVKESCQLIQQNGSLWPYPNQTIVVLNQETPSRIEQNSNIQLGNGLSGLIGIGTNRGSPGNASGFSANFGDSIMGQFFLANPRAVNFTFGMMLNKPLKTPRGSTASTAPVSGAGSAAGVLHWLQPDPSAYDSTKLSWATAINGTTASFPTVSSNTTGAGDWFLNFDGWMMSSSVNSISSTNAILATVDMVYPEIYLPADQATLIHDVIPNATLRTDMSTLGSLSEAWSIPCDSSFSFRVLVDGQNFTMDQSVLVVGLPDGTCVSGIEGWADESVTTYLFGSRFVSTIYLIVNVQKEGPNQMGFAPRSGPSSRSKHVRTIVGAVVGGSAALVGIALAISWWFVRRRRTNAHRVALAARDRSSSVAKPQEVGLQPLFSPTSTASPSSPSFLGTVSQGPSFSPTSAYTGWPAVLQTDNQTVYSIPDLPDYETSERTQRGFRDETIARTSQESLRSARRPLPIPPQPSSTTHLPVDKSGLKAIVA